MLKQIKIYQLISVVIGLASCYSTLIIIPATAREVSSNNTNIDVNITQGTGHLFNLSRTDRRIKSMMIDNPEVLTKNILFNTNGCSKTACKNSSILLISSRAGGIIGYTGTIRVITKDRFNQLHPYTITVRISKIPQTENETNFFTDRVATPQTNAVFSPRRNLNNRFLRTIPVNISDF